MSAHPDVTLFFNDRGFKLIAEGSCAVYEDPSADNTELLSDLNAFPWYFGQPPSTATDRRTIDKGWLAGAFVCDKALGEEDLRALMLMTSPPAFHPESCPEGKTIETLAMVNMIAITS